MVLLIIFVTASHTVVEAVTSRKAALVPSDMRANNYAQLGGVETVLSAYRVSDQSDQTNFKQFITARVSGDVNGVIIMTDESLPGLVDLLGNQFSVNRFTPPGHGVNVQNALIKIVSRCLRAYKCLLTRFRDRKYEQIIRLPLRNFNAPEIAELRDVCRDMANQDNFSREFDAILGRFRKRQFPKKVSSRPNLYFVDDSKNYYEFGHEIHARADSAMPPHNCLCVLANTFRFGMVFDGNRHFNVSHERETPMTVNFLDCHGATRRAGGAQHVNMFSNDFF